MNLDKLIINVALTGIVPSKEQNPHLPLTPKEIVRDAERAHRLGASIVHIHARENDGNPSHRKEIYSDIIDGIRQRCDDLIITVSTSGRRTKDLSERMRVLELDGDRKPDMASLTLGSINFKEGYSLNPPESIIAMLESMRSSGIKPELEIFDTGMANYAKYLFKKDYLQGTYYCNLILGSMGTMSATPRNLIHLVDELPAYLIWAATGVGRFAFKTQCLSLSMGGHVRVGLEDGIYMDEYKRELATNEKLILRMRKVAEAIGREIATPGEVRSILNL